jgi:hypothetical protein
VVTTKSGGNQFHGSLFEFLRNEKLDARNFFARTDAPKPPFKLNQYGASLGGPVLFPKYNGRNRMFFFLNYEGYREVFGDTQLQTVPVAAIRAGNFAGVKVIYDPLTTRPNPAGGASIRTPFPNALIPAERFDRLGAGMVNMWPLPQRAGLSNNYVVNPIKRSSIHRGDGRFDYQLSPKDALFFRYSADWSGMTIPDTFNTDIGGNEASFAGDDNVKGAKPGDA